VARRRIKPITHEDRLTVVDHLDELRTRVITSIVAFGVAFAICSWQNHWILRVMNKPLHGKQPLTLGITEPFTTTFTNVAYAAIILALPVVLYQLYSFVLPAFSPTERKVATPLVMMVPILFIAGVVFAYFVVLPPATKFLLGFNSDQYRTEIRAKDYYGFATMSLAAMGLLFQVPVGILALTRLGITTPQKLRKNRRYAILVIAVVAALLPTIDPVTMTLEMLPLVVLYEASILLAQWFGTPRSEVSDSLASAEGS
jgi:sec-independent protein translocase protein TatC